MAVNKVIQVSGRYISGHGPSQVTEIAFTGGNTREMRFEQRGKERVLTIHGADELKAFTEGVAALELPVHGVEPDEPAKDEDRGEANTQASLKAADAGLPWRGNAASPDPDDVA